MSQEMNYQRVATVTEANNFQREFGPVIAQIMSTAPSDVVAGVKKCCKRKRVKSKTLLAPSEMKVIQADYDKHLVSAKKQTFGQVEQLKVAAIATIVKSQDNLLVSEPEVVAEKIQRIVNSRTVQEVSQEIKTTFSEIKSQHSSTFALRVSDAVKESAIAVGFKKVSVQEPHIGLVRVVATNQTGQNLIAEITTEKQVDIRTELVGYTDGSCETVMRRFDDEMSIRGVTMGHKEQKPTYGIPRMPYAQRLLKPRVFKKRTFNDEPTCSEDNTMNTISIKQL